MCGRGWGFRLARVSLPNVVALAGCLVAPVASDGQGSGFSNPVANRDGSLMYFMSHFRHKSSNAEPGWFQYSHSGGFRAVRFGESPLTAYRFVDGRMDVSGDGRLLAWSLTTRSVACFPVVGPYGSDLRAGDSIPQSRCYEVFRSQARILGPGVDYPLNGEVQLSRNGRWALQFGYAPLALLDTTTWNYDMVGPPNATETSPRALTSRGEVLVAGYGPEIEIWTWKGSRRLTPAEPPAPRSAVISDAGNWIAYLTKDGRLHSIEVASGPDRLLHPDAVRSQHFSDDGGLLLFVAESWPSGPLQVFVVDPDGSRKRQLTFLREGCTEAALSGDGRVAYAVSTSNRLLRIDVGTGAIQELVGRTPFLSDIGLQSPGSFVRLWGSGLSDGVATASGRLPASLGGASVRIGDLDLRILSVSPTEIRGQIPWETTPGWTWLELPSLTAFELPAKKSYIPVLSPYFLYRALIDPTPEIDPLAVIVHEGFDSLVSHTSPARPGEVVHLYGVGFGPVSPPVASGEPGPAKPLALVTGNLRCEMEGLPVPVLYAGLAPGLYGIYQISVRLPDLPGGIPWRTYYLTCRVEGGISALTGIPVRPQEQE